jgi:hypothetical protein
VQLSAPWVAHFVEARIHRSKLSIDVCNQRADQHGIEQK